MKPLITRDTPVTQELLNTIAHLPTKSLSEIVEDEFFKKLTDQDFMRIGVLLARKSYLEGGSPIGGVIIDDETRKIVGKGHNTLVQENHPYNHGETSAVRDAGRLEDPEGLALYAKHQQERPDQDLEDWQGLAAVREAKASKAP
jgi:cytosine/creatinine deaminase